MKLIVSSTALAEAAKNLCRVINAKNALPILGDILCEANEQDRTLRLTASDSEIWATTSLQLQECEGEGRFCVGATRLQEAVGELSEQPVTITATTEGCDLARAEQNRDSDSAEREQARPTGQCDNVFTLTHETGDAHFPIDNADEYPAQPELKDIATVWMPWGEVMAALNACQWATSNDDLRPIMNGVYFNFTKDFADITASDGHVLMRYRQAKDYGCEGSFIMPRKVAKLLPAMMAGEDKEDEANILWNDRQGCVESDRLTLTFRLIEGRYPNYQSVIPEDHIYWAEVQRGSLLNAVRKVSPFASDSSQLLRCEFERERLTLQGEDYDFSVGASDRIYADCNVIDPVTIGLKASGLASMLTKLPYAELAVRFSDPSRAVTFEEKPEEGRESKQLGSILGLMMPMLVND